MLTSKVRLFVWCNGFHANTEGDSIISTLVVVIKTLMFTYGLVVYYYKEPTKYS